VAGRLLADDTFETWVVVGDRVIAAVVIPKDPERSEPMIAPLNDPGFSASGSIHVVTNVAMLRRELPSRSSSSWIIR
jgi:hypothetical protein